jgi:hypothetical protein
MTTRLAMTNPFTFDGVTVDLSLTPGGGILFTTPPTLTGLPTTDGVYALVHHPRRIAAIGEGRSLRGRYAERRTWTANGVRKDPKQARRVDNPNCIELVRVAFECGLDDGWEFYPLTTDPRFQHGQPGGCARRQAFERALHLWLPTHSRYRLSNGQTAWRICATCPPQRRVPR